MRLTLALLLALFTLRPGAAAEPAKPRVKLAVLVVFDQMRGDYMDRWRPLFGPGGFTRMQSEGAWFKNCYYPYGTTQTGPGHASMLSGTCADHHGISANDWYDARTGDQVYCAGSTRYKPVPPLPIEAGKDTKPEKPKAQGAPVRLLSESVADVLKEQYGAKAKVFGLSLKDRSAILPTGKRPDGAYWFSGHFGTSDYYTDRVHPWVETFNTSKTADRWFGKSWTRFRPDLDYAKYSGPDDAPGEGKGVGTSDSKTGYQGKVFPHPIDGGKPVLGKKYYEALATSPFGNELLLEFAKTCIVAEKLGTHDAPDLLVVSFSSNDLIGHTWGPDSQEVLDVTLRSDAMMAEFLKFLDDKVGKGNYVLAITADHGICALPEASRAAGRDARRIDPAGIRKEAEKHLRGAFTVPQPDPKAKAAKTTWVEAMIGPWMYLNPRLVKASGKSSAEVARSLAAFVAKQDGVERVFTREDLEAEFPATDVIGRRVKRSFYPARCGDVYVVLKPYYMFSKPLSTGTNHGTPHDYDCHVPLLVIGPGIPGGPRDERVTPQATAAIFARFLGVRPPKDADFPVPTTLERN